MPDTENNIQGIGIPEIQMDMELLGDAPEIQMQMEIYGMDRYPLDKTLTKEDVGADAKAAGDAIRAISTDLTDLAADVLVKTATWGDLEGTGANDEGT